ncbi:MAG: SCO6880 family protein [Acidimicrobiales bacterium]
MAERTSYRFEPLERRGLLLGLGAGQLAVIIIAVLAAIASIKAWPGTAGVAVAVGSLALAGALCRPVSGRPPLQWVNIGGLFLARPRRLRLAPPATLLTAPADEVRDTDHRPRRTLRLPAKVFAPGLFLCELPASPGPIGALVDERAGTAAALLRVRGGSFCLLDDVDKERKLGAWAAVLESVSSHRSSLVRLQWCQRALPGDSASQLDHLHRAGDIDSPGFAGQVALLERAGAKAWRHETLLVVAVRRRGRARGRHGRLGDEDADAVRNEVRSLRAQMRNVGLVCEGVLDQEGAAVALGAFLVPSLDRYPGAHPWPLALEERWADVRADRSWHRTYWVAEWPRSSVGPDFLSPLLIGTGRRSFSVVMAPVPPERAERDAQSSRTAQAADAQLRAQGGFLETARQRRQAEALEGREERLVDGRGVFKLSGYFTVSGADKAGLEAACSDLERAAGAAKVCLRLLYGQQKEALTWALPLGRGL